MIGRVHQLRKNYHAQAMKYLMRRTGGSGQTGFTLVEVMVALTVVGLALPALLLLFQGHQDHARHLRDKSVALWVAENQLRLQYLQQRLGQSLVEDSGDVSMAGQQWYWQVDSEPTVISGMKKIEISVRRSIESQPLAQRVGFIYD